MKPRDPPAKLSSRLMGSTSSNQSQKLRLVGTTSTSKSETEDDPVPSVPSPSNLTILEDLQQSGLPPNDTTTTKSTKRKSSKHARPSPANKTTTKQQQQQQQPKQHHQAPPPPSPEDIEKGQDDCTAGFILDAIVDTTNHNRGTKSNQEWEPTGNKEKILHRLEQARILKDLATTEVLIKKEKKEETLVSLRKPWVFVSIVVLAIGALGVVTAAIWTSIG